MTESGMVIDVKTEHFLKASLPIEVTESGIVTEVKPEQPSNTIADRGDGNGDGNRGQTSTASECTESN